MWYTIADTGTWDLIASVPGDQSITGTQCMIVMLHAFRYVLQSAICMNPNNGMLNFQDPAIQNLRIQDLKKLSQHFMFLLILHAAAKVCVYTKN